MSESLEDKVAKLHEECLKLQESVATLLDSGMKEKTILVLMNHYTGLPQKTIKKVMYGLHDLEIEYFGEQEQGQ